MDVRTHLRKHAKKGVLVIARDRVSEKGQGHPSHGIQELFRVETREVASMRLPLPFHKVMVLAVLLTVLTIRHHLARHVCVDRTAIITNPGAV
jgi:hypothetical protein